MMVVVATAVVVAVLLLVVAVVAVVVVNYFALKITLKVYVYCCCMKAPNLFTYNDNSRCTNYFELNIKKTGVFTERVINTNFPWKTNRSYDTIYLLTFLGYSA